MGIPHCLSGKLAVQVSKKLRSTNCLCTFSSAPLEKNSGYFNATISLLLRESCHQSTGHANEQVLSQGTFSVGEHGNKFLDKSYVRKKKANKL